MNKDDIIKILKTINYPNYSRDIVSFGIVTNIEISKDILIIDLKLSAEENILDKIKIDISSALRDYFSDIKINIDKSDNSNIVMDSNIKTLENVKHIIAIASGKGGVGKSTTAVNLASLLSENLKVGLLDLDIYGPSLPTAIGCHDMPQMNANKLLDPIEKYGMKLMSFGFLNNESAPTIWRGPMVSRMTQQFFEQVNWGELDVLLLDLPPGTGDIQLTLVQKIALSGAIIITTPQDLALLDVKKASDMFNKLNTPILGIIENMSSFRLEGEIHDNAGNLFSGSILLNNSNHKIENGKFSINFDFFSGQGGIDESKRLGVPLLSKIPINSDLAICTDKGTPYVMKHKNTYIYKCYEDIAQKIMNNFKLD